MGSVFPFKHGDHIQHCSGQGDIFIIRLVDETVHEGFAESVTGNGHGTRVINPDNWKKVKIPQ